MTFYTPDNVYCPNCPPRFRRSKPDERVGVILDCHEGNYHGTCTDIGYCVECEKYYSIRYKVDEITEIWANA